MTDTPNDPLWRVLAALTDAPEADCARNELLCDEGFFVGSGGDRTFWGWATIQAHPLIPAEALETLATRELWPWAPDAPEAPHWRTRTKLYTCTSCNGYRTVRAPNTRTRTLSCPHCDDGWTYAITWTHTPDTLVDLVNVARLGVDVLRALHGASVALRDLAGRHDMPWAIVPFSAWAQRKYREHLDVSKVTTFPIAFEVGVRTQWAKPTVLPSRGPWRAGWTALQTIAQHGATLLDVTDARLVLGVPRLDPDRRGVR